MNQHILLGLLLFLGSWLGAQAQLSRFDLNRDNQVKVSDITALTCIVADSTESSLYADNLLFILHCGRDSIYLPSTQIDSIRFDQGEDSNLKLCIDSLIHYATDTIYADTLSIVDTLYRTDTLLVVDRDTLYVHDTVYQTFTLEVREYQQLIPTAVANNLCNVTFIPIYGQSLSEGCDSKPLVTTECKYPAAIMFSTGIRNQCVHDSSLVAFAPLMECVQDSLGETVASGCAEMLTELFAAEQGIPTDDPFWETHKFLFGAFGRGGAAIDELLDESDTTTLYYQGLVNGVKAAKAICDSRGWTLNVPGFIWMQGESDQKLRKTKEYYEEALMALQHKFNEAVKAITLQENDVECFCYQISSQNTCTKKRKPTFGGVEMEVPTAQMELIQRRDEFRGAAPTYALDFVNSKHLTAAGEKLMGAYFGRAVYQHLAQRLDSTLLIRNINVSGNTIVITCNRPIEVDTTWVSMVDHYGFTLLNEANEQIITEATTIDNCIVLACSASPLGCVLYYGFNGEEKHCGRISGSRGNIRGVNRSPQTFTIGETDYLLHDYLYAFYRQL